MRRRALRRISARILKPVVEAVEKRVLLATFMVTNTTDTAGVGSLRWAIGQSNATAGPNTIDFNISGTGVQTIDVTSALPAITVPVTIDGTSQSGYTSTPLIELDGAGAGTAVDGLDISGGGSTIKGLAINRFKGEGIRLTVTGNNTIENDFIGTDPTGTIAEGNGQAGVYVAVNSNTNVISNNLISGNLNDGIDLNGQLFAATNPLTSGNLITGNLIGTDVTGEGTLGNTNDGIAVQNAPLTTIGGLTAATRNIISGNGSGVELFDNSDNSVVEGNYIGTDFTGEAALGNSGPNGFFQDNLVFRGISNSTVGGTVAGAGNVISGGQNYGIDCFVIGSGGLAIQGNLIGTDATGTKALPNKTGGVFIWSPSNVTIGGTVVGARNVISGNTGDGIGTFANGPGLMIEGNYIGTDITGIKPLGNGGDGINATYTGISVGGLGTGQANIIANNGFTAVFDHSGVRVTNTDTPVLSNSIYNNMLDGIELNGGNKGQVAPVLTSASATPTGSTISGSLTASPGTYTVQFFANPTLNTSGHGEGQTLIGTAIETISGSSTSFTESFPAGFPAGSLITATATDAAGNTSQFSTAITGSGSGAYLVNPTISVSSSEQVIPTGGSATYTFTITNPNAVAISGVVFYDPIPAGTVFGSGTSSSGSSVVVTQGQVTSDIGTIGAGQTVLVTVVLTTTLNTPARFANLGSVAATTPSLLPGIVNASVTTSLNPAADLAVSIANTSGSTAVGDKLTHVITVTNKGLDPATGVILTDTLPVGTTYVSSTVSGGSAPTVSSGVLTDIIGSLANGEAFTLTLTVLVGLDAYPSATDIASVVGLQTDPDTSNNQAAATATISEVADVSVTASPSLASVPVDTNEVYTVTVTNSGPSPAFDVTFSDDLPANVDFISATSNSGSTPQESGGMVTDNIGTLAAGASIVYTITILPTGSTGSSITNVATANSSTSDPNNANNTVTTTNPVVPAADLAVSSITVAPTELLEGGTVTFTIVVTNHGPSTATGATFSDTLPAGLTYVSGTLVGGSIGDSGQVVTATLGDILSGGSATLTIVATTSAVGTFTNTATVASPVVDPNTANNSGSVTVTVDPVVDVSVSLSGDSGPGFTGNALTFTALVTNNGPATATNVIFTDPLFAGATFESVESGSLFGTDVNGVATLNIGSLAAGASVTVTLIVLPTEIGSFTQTATVTPTEADSNEANNTARFTSSVVAPYQSISFSATTYSVDETAGFVPITVVRTGDTVNDVTVHFVTLPLNAMPGVDYQMVDGLVYFPAGVTSATIDVPVLANPYDNHDEFVNLQLDTPSGGALLQAPGGVPSLAPINATLQIIDVDPDVIGPKVTDLKLIGLVNEISAIEVDTTGHLNPATATSTLNYSIIALGGGGKTGLPYGTIIPVDLATYNDSTGAVTLIPAIPLPGNELYMVGVNGMGLTAVSDRAGNPLNSIFGVIGGSDYVETVARGTNLTYTDQHGSQVNLKLTGPGTLDIDRSLSGEVTRLQVVGAGGLKTVVTGSVHGGNKRTTIDTILGLGDFGSIRFDLTTPAFYVVNTVYPSSNQLTDAAAVDTLLTPPTTPASPRKTTKPVKVTKPKKPAKTVTIKAEAIVDPTPQILDFAPTTTTKAKTTPVVTTSKHPHAATAHAVHARKTF